MKKLNLFVKKVLLLSLISVLIATIALTITGCSKTLTDDISSQKAPSKADTASAVVVGNGNTQFNFTVISSKGKQTNFLIKTDKKTVGDALIENNLIKGDDGAYGMYVKTVNGETLDFDKDGLYWAFYENGEYAQQGVEKTIITDNSNYSFKAQK